MIRDNDNVGSSVRKSENFGDLKSKSDSRVGMDVGQVMNSERVGREGERGETRSRNNEEFDLSSKNSSRSSSNSC